MKSKKILFTSVALLGMFFLLTGCGYQTVDYVEENMSEWTKVYYYGEGEGMYASISSGTREEEYLMNGKSEDTVDFSLLSVIFDDSPSSNPVKITVTIDGASTEEELEIGGINSAYMVDLGKALAGNEEISIAYGGKEINLYNLSKDFEIDDEKAISIATSQLEENIVALKSGKTLNAECYLRVLDKKANNFDDIFWCFTVVNANGESFSVIISTTDGSILAKS